MDRTVQNRTILWWIAFVAEMIAAILETFDRDPLKAIGLYCLAGSFLLMALGKGSEEPLWRKVTMAILVTVAISLFIYRFAWQGRW